MESWLYVVLKGKPSRFVLANRIPQNLGLWFVERKRQKLDNSRLVCPNAKLNKIGAFLRFCRNGYPVENRRFWHLEPAHFVTSKSAELSYLSSGNVSPG